MNAPGPVGDPSVLRGNRRLALALLTMTRLHDQEIRRVQPDAAGRQPRTLP